MSAPDKAQPLFIRKHRFFHALIIQGQLFPNKNPGKLVDLILYDFIQIHFFQAKIRGQILGTKISQNHLHILLDLEKLILDFPGI